MDPSYTAEQSARPHFDAEPPVGKSLSGLRRSAGLFNLKLASPPRNAYREAPQSPPTPTAPPAYAHPARKRAPTLKRPHPFNNSKPGKQNGFLARSAGEKRLHAESFQGARPLQTAFAPHGLVSKRYAACEPQPRVPETPCKAQNSVCAPVPLPPSSANVGVALQRFSIDCPETPTRFARTSTPLKPTPLKPNKFDFSENISLSMTPTTPETPERFGLDTPDTTLSFYKLPESSPKPKHMRTSSGMPVIDRAETPHTPAIPLNTEPLMMFDEHLMQRFGKVQSAQLGEFSAVFVVAQGTQRLAVKRTKRPLASARERLRLREEVNILQTLRSDGPDGGHIVQLIDEWEHNAYGYILTEFCENGDLSQFLTEQGRVARLEEWRVWKIFGEVLLGLAEIHAHNILHLDLKPANVFVTFEGHLKIGDFGLATRCPVPPHFEREGDREYIAPEVLERQQYCTAADIFSLGIMMVEVAANIVLPDNGVHWQRLRSGDLSDAGHLSSGDLSADRDDKSGAPPAWAPRFLTDGSFLLDKIVSRMLSPDPQQRPSARELLSLPEIELVNARGQAGAVVYEGEFGPEPDEEGEVWQRT